MADEFQKSVQCGLKLSKRIYYGKESFLDPPKQHQTMEKSTPPSSLPSNQIPTAPMIYAMISKPAIVENPDIRSYQPYVHGKCKPPALIPLHMYDIEVKIDCYLDVAFVTVIGTWRLHCVDGAESCDCLLAIPMGEQGSVLGFDIKASGGSYHSQLVKVEDTTELDGLIKADNGGFLKPNIFTLRIPKVDGGSKLLVEAKWSQKLLYHEGRLCLHFPFTFPAYVFPAVKCLNEEKILVNVNSSTGTEFVCKSATHPLKEVRRQGGKTIFSYEAKCHTWSRTDFECSYPVSSRDIHGGVLLQSPPPNDLDQREMFTFYLFPGYNQNRRVFRKRVVFLIDISGSMKGAPLENVKQSVLTSLCKFNEDDSFNIIAFNGEVHIFAPSMELATEEAVQRANEWFSLKLTAEGDTNILLPMKQALEMVSDESISMSSIFLVTDGTVENEKEICNVVKEASLKKGQSSPRISTFGIGSYCNHYFLRMLAQIGRGHYDAAYDCLRNSVALRLERFLTTTSSIILSNIEVECFNQFESTTLYPSAVQDLSYECPVIISGRYKGKLPESLKVCGTLADMSKFKAEFKVQETKDIPLDKVYAQTQIDMLTAMAWFNGSKEVEKKVAEISMQTGFPSEYSRMVLVQTQGYEQESDFVTIHGKESYNKASLQKMVSCKKLFPLQSLGVGFGDLKNTAENLPPGVTVKTLDATDKMVKAATGCCRQFLDRFCCMCFIQTISKLSDQCVITASQICAALACCECLSCCYDLCDVCAACC